MGNLLKPSKGLMTPKPLAHSRLVNLMKLLHPAQPMKTTSPAVYTHDDACACAGKFLGILDTLDIAVHVVEMEAAGKKSCLGRSARFVRRDSRANGRCVESVLGRTRWVEGGARLP